MPSAAGATGEVEIKVVVLRRGEVKLKVPENAKVEDVVKMLGLNPVEYVAILDGRVVPEDEPVGGAAVLKLVPVVSGG